MKLAVTAFIVTVVVGFIADDFFTLLMNWPNAGAIFATATMGAFLLWQIQRKNKPD